MTKPQTELMREAACQNDFKEGTSAFDAMKQTLEYYRDYCSGFEPSISLFHRMLDQALSLADSMDKQEPVAWIVDGRIEQLLFFDEESANIAAAINAGNVLPLYTTPQPDRVAELEERLKEESQAASDMSYDLSRMGEKCLELEAQLSAIRQAGNELESYTFYDSLGNNGEGVEEFTGFRNDDWIEFLRVVYEGKAIIDTIKEGEE